jgi:hypothetical protein
MEEVKMRTITKSDIEQYAIENIKSPKKYTDHVRMKLSDAVKMTAYLVEDIGWITPEFFLTKKIPYESVIIEFDNYGDQFKAEYIIKAVEEEVLYIGNSDHPDGEIIVGMLYVHWSDDMDIYCPICMDLKKKDLHLSGFGLMSEKEDVTLEEKILVTQKFKPDVHKMMKTFADMLYQWQAVQLAYSHPVYNSIFKSPEMKKVYDAVNTRQFFIKFHHFTNAEPIMKRAKSKNTDKYKLIPYSSRNTKKGITYSPSKWKKV